MTYDDFILKLESYGISLKVEHSPGLTDFYLSLNGINVSVEDYKAFGRYCGGAYAPCSRTGKVDFDKKDFSEAIRTAIKIITNQVRLYELEVDFYDCVEFLHEYRPSKTDEVCAKRMRKVLKENYKLMSSKKKARSKANRML